MLVLSRRKDEGVKVFKDGLLVAELIVVELRGDKVRLGFSADDSVVIHRDEVVVRIEAEGGAPGTRG